MNHFLFSMFERQVERTPAKTAIIHAQSSCTYKELNERANRIARWLIAQGVEPGTVVAVALDASIDLVSCLLGVLKAGGMYMPLDPAYPPDRLAYMISHSDPHCLLTTTSIARRLDNAIDEDVATLHLDVDNAGLARLSALDVTTHERCSNLDETHPAYVIYTSGSTGRPKGVVVPHRALTNLLIAMMERFCIGEDDIVVSTTSISFDIAAIEVYLPLLTGSELHLISRDIAIDGQVLCRYVDEAEPTLMQGTPALWQLLREAGWAPKPGLRMLCGGEALPPDLANFLTTSPKACEAEPELWNMYGPTETTIWSLMERVRHGRPISLGDVIRQTYVHVLNQAMEPVLPGLEGEIYISGEGLAHGYLGQSALTSERFVACPFSNAGDRMYRTGDLARWRLDGTLEFLGRTDEQVKIRGFRIELGEIEAVLVQQENVSQACVLVRESEAGTSDLAAYVVARANDVLDPADLKQALARKLPHYMLPVGIVVMDGFPLTPNGKIDRKAFPRLDLTSNAARQQPAVTNDEKLLCALFCEVLRVPDIGVEESFFDMGGNSLLATSLLSRLRAERRLELPIRTLFDAPSARALAPHLARATASRQPLLPTTRPSSIPLSFAQQRLWFLYGLEGPSTTYNLPVTLRLQGSLDYAALQSALNDLIKRHEALRTRFRDGPNGGEQDIVASDIARVELQMHRVDPCALPQAVSIAAMRLFDLKRDLPIYADLFRLADDSHVLLLCLHHIASDGWSLAPLLRDLGHFYNARKRGDASTLPPLPIQYADYALWQRKWLGDIGDPDSPLSRQIEYWRHTLEKLPERLELPTDRPHPPMASFRGDVVPFEIDAQTTVRLNILASSAQVSLFMVLQAACAILLTKLGAGDDIPMGTPVAGRTDTALNDCVGFFVNTLVLRTNTSGNPSFRELLGRIRDTNLDAYTHQDAPFDALVEELNPLRTTSYHPLFQIMLVLQNNIAPTFAWKDLDVSLDNTTTRTAKFDLTIEFSEQNIAGQPAGGLRGEIEYASDLYDRVTVETLTRYIAGVLEQAVLNPDRPLADIDILNSNDQTTILESWNDTAHPVPSALYPELFEQRVHESFALTAVICRDVDWTYDALNRKANQIARWLLSEGARPQTVIGLSMRRSPHMLASLLGVLKAGATYLPLDPDYPAQRLEFIVEDAQPSILIIDENVAASLPSFTRDLPRLIWSEDGTNHALDEIASGNLVEAELERPLRATDAAYIIYTSGSTGQPKGVIVTHRGIPNLAGAYIECFRLNESARFMQLSSINFDPTFCEMCCTLLSGATLILAYPEDLLSPDRQLEVMQAGRPTHITFSPTILAGMSEESLAECRNLMVAGEACSVALAQKWSRGRRMINAYGPTETTVDALYWECQLSETDLSVPVGRPLWNTRVFVLDTALKPVPPGVTGELYICGLGVARGYLNRPEMTAERFVACPFGPSGSRMYRTGDLAKWRADGVIDFVGRTDDQIKIRGMRIELSEIKSHLERNPDVAQAAVIARDDLSGNKQLVGYVVARDIYDGARDTDREIDSVRTWQSLHESDYSEQLNVATQHDFRGWNSSYDEAPIPLPEMLAWQAATVERISALRPQRVLEIGVGSGLILWEVAPHCEYYTGIDFSPSVIEALQTRIAGESTLRDRVELHALAAHELECLPSESFDTVVINSVAQYFPSEAYLLDVLRQAMILLKPGGRIFLGDIRNHRLARCFATTVARHRGLLDEESPASLRALINNMMELESELLFDPDFFATIAVRIDSVAGVDLQLKRGAYRNELTCFRFDVVLHKQGAACLSVGSSAHTTWLAVGKSVSSLFDHLRTTRHRILRVTGIPDARIAAEVAAEKSLWFEKEMSAVDSVSGAVDHEVLHEMALAQGYNVKITCCDTSDGACFDAVFICEEDDHFLLSDLYQRQSSDQEDARLTNQQHIFRRNRDLGLELRRNLADSLPNHMVPAAILVMDRFPLTSNGKLDISALPAPDFNARDVSPPRTSVEKKLVRLFCDVLGLNTVGITDRFFDLGGDSIRSILLVSRARAEGLMITTRDVFMHQSPKAILEAISTRTDAVSRQNETDVKDISSYRALVMQTPDPVISQLTPAEESRAHRSETWEISDEICLALRQTVPDLYHTDVGTIALTAFSLAFVNWRHERDPSAKSALRLDWRLSTVEAALPIKINTGVVHAESCLMDASAMARALKRIKEQVRAIPYGRELYQAASAEPISQVRLTVDMGGPATDDLISSMLPHPVLDLRLAAGPDPHSSWTVSLAYGESSFETEDLTNLLSQWLGALQSMARLADEPNLAGLTPSDLKLVNLRQSDIDLLERRYGALADVLPLSSLQQGLLLHTIRHTNGIDPYQSQTILSLEGALDVDRLYRATEDLLRRHATLRTAFVHEGVERPVQVITSSFSVPWTFHDFSLVPMIEQETRINDLCANDAAERFDLRVGPLMRFILIRLELNRHQLIVADHHILIDGWSMAVLWRDLLSLYRHGPEALAPAIPFSRYLEWGTRQNVDTARAAWASYLGGLQKATLVAASTETPAMPEKVSVHLSGTLTRKLTGHAVYLGTTLSTLIQTAWGVMLSCLTGQRDVIFGVTVSERPAEEVAGVEDIVGLLINTIPLRMTIAPNDSFKTLSNRLRDEQWDMMPHYHLGLPDILHLCGLGNLFDTYLVLQNYPTDERTDSSDDLIAHEISDSAGGISHYPLGMTVVPGVRMRLVLGYNALQFDSDQIQTIIMLLETILETMVRSPEHCIDFSTFSESFSEEVTL